MSNTDWVQPPRLTEPPSEYLVQVETYVSSPSALALRKPVIQRKKTDKRDISKQLVGVTEDGQKRVKEKGSWMSLSRGSAAVDQWWPAVCNLYEDGERCLLNVYLDGTMLHQTISIHLLSHTDIRQADSSLFLRTNCIGIYCAESQRWCSTPTTDPLYLHFPSTTACNVWLVLLRSYAIPEIYGRHLFPGDGGLYRIWRQVSLTIVSGRGLGHNKSTDAAGASGDPELRTDSDGGDVHLSCDIHINDVLCGRTTVKSCMGHTDWHENFRFSDLPPFENLYVNVWREKKSSKPAVLGVARVSLANFRRGECVEGWFPVLQMGAMASAGQVGEVRIRFRVDEEIVLPSSKYTGLLNTLNSRNFLEWMGDFEGNMQLKSISDQLIPIAIAKGSLTKDTLEIADREVDSTPHSHNTLFRGNTILTKTMESCMSWYGKAFLEASIGSVIRRLCNDRVAIEVDPVRSGKNTKDIERNVDQLVHWSREVWKQIYDVRHECPCEMRKLFAHIRGLVAKRYEASPGNSDFHWQIVSAFCFLRFIVPAILHPHLFGLYPGLPSNAVQRSLTLIAKVIQNLANLNTTLVKEEYMRGVKQFINESLPSMKEYIQVVSTPGKEKHTYTKSMDSDDLHNIALSLRERQMSMSVLERESIPTLPHNLDIPRQLAMVNSAIIRGSKPYHRQSKLGETLDRRLEDLCDRALEVEEQALHRVAQFASYAASEWHQHVMGDFSQQQQNMIPFSNSNPDDRHARHPPTAAYKRLSRRVSRPSTAPSASISDVSLPLSPMSPPPTLTHRASQSEIGAHPPSSPEGDRFRTLSRQRSRLFHPRSTSTDSVPSHGHGEVSILPSRSFDPPTDTSDDPGKKKGLLRSMWTRR